VADDRTGETGGGALKTSPILTYLEGGGTSEERGSFWGEILLIEQKHVRLIRCG